MAEKLVTIKEFDGQNYNEIYPKTEASQIKNFTQKVQEDVQSFALTKTFLGAITLQNQFIELPLNIGEYGIIIADVQNLTCKSEGDTGKTTLYLNLNKWLIAQSSGTSYRTFTPFTVCLYGSYQNGEYKTYWASAGNPSASYVYQTISLKPRQIFQLDGGPISVENNVSSLLINIYGIK